MRIITAFLLAGLISGCAVIDPLVYKIDIPQGNYIEQHDVDRLRVGMNREQVAYVLGSPVAENMFRADTWHYVYHLKPGRGEKVRRELVVHFDGDQLDSIGGDFEPHEDFYTPLDS